MILSHKTMDYFKSIGAKVSSEMGKHQNDTPYHIKGDPIIKGYECLRDVWLKGKSISETCAKHKVSRTVYYENENKFVAFGLPGLFTLPNGVMEEPELEALVIMVRKCRPSISQTAILRIAEGVPITTDKADRQLISNILSSNGYGHACMHTDKEFWGRLQRSLEELHRIKKSYIKGRKKKDRRATFFVDGDQCHKRLECLREIYYDPSGKIKEKLIRYNIPLTTYYRLVNEYRMFGPWAVIPASTPGKNDSISMNLQLEIILKKLRYPHMSPQEIVTYMKLCCSRFVVNRVIKRWGLGEKNLQPLALDQFIQQAPSPLDKEPFTPIKPACHNLPDQNILQTRRVNRHFELILKKMKTHSYNICDPGSLLLTPFVNDLGIVQAFETYGPLRLRGKEITNLALLNVFRILAGYRRINHLSNNRDRSVALASGLGLFGSSSKFYENTLKFKFNQINDMRLDLVARAKELGLIEGLSLGFDFHFKEFYGANSSEKGIGKGPSKSGDMVPGFRPHVAWDLATNVIVSIAYYQGGTRSPAIIRRFCEQNIFPILNPAAIQEIYMDSEYTKESDFTYFKEITDQKGDIFICLKKNKQIKKLIAPALKEVAGWTRHDDVDERKTIKVILPKTKLHFTIVMLRDRKIDKNKKPNIRCFGCTDTNISGEELLKKYRYRWLVENGLKDLVASYFIDEIFGQDPEKIEFEFYCIMIARLAYEYFLKELGGHYFEKEDGSKCSLNSMRNLLFEKRNCKISQNVSGDIEINILDSGMEKLLGKVSNMLESLKAKGKNKVLWWNNRGVALKAKNQYDELTT